MSRTKRKIVKWGEDGFELIIGEEPQKVRQKIGGRKMKPYTSLPNDMKFKASKTDHVPGSAKGVSAYDKLITKNANRAQKKAVRQKVKKELKEELQNIQL